MISATTISATIMIARNTATFQYHASDKDQAVAVAKPKMHPWTIVSVRLVIRAIKAALCLVLELVELRPQRLVQQCHRDERPGLLAGEILLQPFLGRR